MNYIKNYFKKLDWSLIVLIGILLVFSFINISDVNSKSGALLLRQVFVVSIGFLAMFITAFFDFRYLKSHSGLALIVYLVVVIFLIAVLFFGEVRGISAWINIFSTYSIQPSEFGKLAVLIILAKYFSIRHKEIYDWKHIFISGLYAGIPAGLTFLQPDFGSMTVYIVLWAVLLVTSGIKASHLLTLILMSLASLAFAWFFVFQPYQKNRIISFVNPYADSRGSGYNSIQSQTTLGSGQALGNLGNRLLYNDDRLKASVPEPFTDFAFAVFGQKTGFLGILAFMGIFYLILHKLTSIAVYSENNFMKLYIIGFVAILSVHAIINIGMNLGLMPITGIPMPFLSYGGSHLTMIMIGMGIIQSYKIHS